MKIRKLNSFTDMSEFSVDFNMDMQQNEYRINRISGFLALLTVVCAGAMYLLNISGLFILDNAKSALVVLCISPFCAFTFITTVVLGVEKPWVKNAVVLSECITVFIMYGFLSMHVVLLFVLPVVKSCLYFNRRTSEFAILFSYIFMLAAHVFSVRFSITPDDPLTVSLYSALVYAFIPRSIEFFLICCAVAFLVRNCSGMIRSTYKYAQKNRQLLSETRNTHYEIVRNLATVSENKSRENGEHIGRVFNYMKILALRFGYSEEKAYDIALASMLHDIGKLIVNEDILSKPSSLTDEEYAEIKKHVVYGHDLLTNSGNEVLEMASVIANQHHERWDGTGYLGLKGEEINILSRMMSVADVFDALTSQRCYKKAWSKEAAYNEILAGSGTQFDPSVVRVFSENYEEIARKCDELNA